MVCRILVLEFDHAVGQCRFLCFGGRVYDSLRLGDEESVFL